MLRVVETESKGGIIGGISNVVNKAMAFDATAEGIATPSGAEAHEG